MVAQTAHPGQSVTSPQGVGDVGPSWQDPEILASIAALARRYCGSDRELRADLYQEGCLAAWLKEQSEPGCPASHLVRVARFGMTHYNRTGHSVDGRNSYHRSSSYHVDSLDAPAGYGDAGRVLEELVPSPARDVQEVVVSVDTARAFLDELDEPDQRLLALRLAGYRQHEVIHTVRLRPTALGARLAAIQGRALAFWSEEGRPALPGLIVKAA